MDSTRLDAAGTAYDAGDWRTAAREYLAAAGSGSPGSGVAFHRAGNALLRMKRYDDAATVYVRALEDATYGPRGAVSTNLGTAHLAAGNRDRAIAAFQSALEEPDYETRYKALQGLAGALYEAGQIEDAGDAYRRAALDDANPDPGKALNNLGLCFMALGRPADAVEAYRAAIDLEDYSGRGRSLANLGLAYMSLGKPGDAVRAFERATGELDYELTGAALAASDAAHEAVESEREVVDGWNTGEMPPVFGIKSEPDSEEIESAFFTRTDDDMKVVDREVRRAQRVERKAGKNVWARVAVWGVLVAVLIGVAVFAWMSGLGFPTQSMTVKGLMDAHRAGKAVANYWVAVPSADVEKEMSNLPPEFASYTIEGMEQSARTSTVDVTVVLDKGAPLTYKLSLLREGVGWKVNGVTNDWRSTGEGS